MSDTTNTGEHGRFSSRRKTAAVLRLLRGEDLELVPRVLGVTAATLSGWHDDFQRELKFLGMTSSPSFVGKPEGNGVAERFIRTPTENLLWVRHFSTVAKLVEDLREFKRRYNGQWLIERRGFWTPHQAKTDLVAASRGLDAGHTCRKVA